MNSPTRAEDIIGLIPDELLDNIANETGVDYSVKKLKGKDVFRLCLFGLLTRGKLSLRILAEIFQSEKFKNLFNIKTSSIKHSGVGMRISNIDFVYFKNIFDHLVSTKEVTAVSLGDKRINARKIDSTIVTLSCKLLKIGIESDTKKMIKYSVEVSGGFPAGILIYTKNKYGSEDHALPGIIKRKMANSKQNIAVFDRGIQKKETYAELCDQEIFFISRLNSHNYKVVKEMELKDIETETMRIISDQKIKFKNTPKHTLRLVTGLSKKTNQKIYFITNVNFLSAVEVSEMYRARWEIETFFKFIKQELNFSHLLSRSENGIKVVAYLTLITAILLTLYKKLNNIEGWVPAKIRFIDQLESYIRKQWEKEYLSALNGDIGLPAYV